MHERGVRSFCSVLLLQGLMCLRSPGWEGKSQVKADEEASLKNGSQLFCPKTRCTLPPLFPRPNPAISIPALLQNTCCNLPSLCQHHLWVPQTFPLNLPLPTCCFITAPNSSRHAPLTQRPLLSGKQGGLLSVDLSACFGSSRSKAPVSFPVLWQTLTSDRNCFLLFQGHETFIFLLNILFSLLWTPQILTLSLFLF